MLSYLLTAIALVFVLEGVLPFLCPQCWRRMIVSVAQFNNRYLRIIGLFSMAIGMVILFVVHHLL